MQLLNDYIAISVKKLTKERLLKWSIKPAKIPQLCFLSQNTARKLDYPKKKLSFDSLFPPVILR
jgi:hypothetical protein